MRWNFETELLLAEWDDGELTYALLPEEIREAVREHAPLLTVRGGANHRGAG